MAVFPQSIVFKTSQDAPGDIIAAASAGGEFALMRGEIVMGLESGRVQLYATDLNGNAVSLVPPVPGYDISGNSIFDLKDVALDGQLEAGLTIVYDEDENSFIAQKLDYEYIENAPTTLNDLVNPGNQFIKSGILGLKGGPQGLNNVNVSQQYSDNDPYPDQVYLQYSQSLESWELVNTISADITGNSIFKLSNVTNPQGDDLPPPSGLNYLRWSGSAYVPSSLSIFEDQAPELSSDLDINGRRIIDDVDYPADLRFALGTKPEVVIERHSGEVLEGVNIELDDIEAPFNRTSLTMEVVGYSGKATANGAEIPVGRRDPGRIKISAPHQMDFYEFYDEQFNQRREYTNYDIVLPLGPPVRPGQIAIWDISQADADRNPFDVVADRPTTGNPITTELSYKDYEIVALNDVQVSTLGLNDVLAYQPNIGKWINVPAAGPGDLGANSIGDLRDVTLTVEVRDPLTNEVTQKPGEITIDTVNRYYINGEEVASIDTAYMGMDDEGFRGITLSHARTSDGMGSNFHVDKDRGIELNAYSMVTMLTGDRTRTDNRPEIQWHPSDPDIRIPDIDNGTFLPPPYIALKYPDVSQLPDEDVLELRAVTYNFPLQPPSQNGQVLTSSVDGQWSWENLGIDNIVVNLGDLTDVDTVTFPPTDGKVLTYQEQSGYWVPLPLPEITTTLSELTDVDLRDPPANNDFLKYNSSLQVWQAGVEDRDWIIETPVEFQTRYSTSINSVPAVGFWTVDQPNINSANTVKLNKTSDNGDFVGSSWLNIITPGVSLLFSEQGNTANYFHFKVLENVVDQGNYYDIEVEVLSVLGSPNGGSVYICTILAGSGGGGSGGGGAINLDDLEDVSANPLVLSGEEVLQYDKPSSTWTARTPFARTLDDLSDVDISSVPPEIGEALTWDGASWVPGEGGGGSVQGEAVERLDVVAVASQVPALSDYDLELRSIGSSGQFVSMRSSKPAWVRFYSTDQARQLDKTRGVDEDPAPGSGVLLETLTTTDDQLVSVSPGTTYYNDDTTVSDTIYVTVRNLDETEVQDISLTVRVFAAVTAVINKGRERIVSTGATIPPGATGFQLLSGCGKMGSFISVRANADSWIRFYSTNASRTADQGRTQTSSPLPGSGVLLEIVAEAGVVYQITPQVGYFNGESEPTDNIFLAIDNLTAILQPINVDVECVPLEGQILAAITGAVTTIDGGSFGSG